MYCCNISHSLQASSQHIKPPLDMNSEHESYNNHFQKEACVRGTSMIIKTCCTTIRNTINSFVNA